MLFNKKQSALILWLLAGFACTAMADPHSSVAATGLNPKASEQDKAEPSTADEFGALSTQILIETKRAKLREIKSKNLVVSSDYGLTHGRGSAANTADEYKLFGLYLIEKTTPRAALFTQNIRIVASEGESLPGGWTLKKVKTNSVVISKGKKTLELWPEKRQMTQKSGDEMNKTGNPFSVGMPAPNGVGMPTPPPMMN